MLNIVKRILLPIVFIFIFFILSFLLFPNGFNEKFFSDNIEKLDEGSDRFITYNALGNNHLPEKIMQYIKEKKGEEPLDDFIDNMYKYIKQVIEGNTISTMSSNNVVSKDEIVNTSIMDKIMQSGINMVDIGNKEVYTNGSTGVKDTYEYFNNKDSYSIGTHGINDKNYIIKEYNNIKIGFITYIQGKASNIEKQSEYETNILERSNLTRDISNLKRESDVIIVNIHWGHLDDLNISEVQQKYTKLLNELGVNVILGYSEQGVQPIKFLTNKYDKKTLVAYSLGNLNFIGDSLDEQLGISLSFQIRKDKTGNIQIMDIEVVPLIVHFEDDFNNYVIEPIYMYNDKMSLQHKVFKQYNYMSVDIIKEKMLKLYGDYLMKY